MSITFAQDLNCYSEARVRETRTITPPVLPHAETMTIYDPKSSSSISPSFRHRSATCSPPTASCCRQGGEKQGGEANLLLLGRMRVDLDDLLRNCCQVHFLLVAKDLIFRRFARPLFPCYSRSSDKPVHASFVGHAKSCLLNNCHL